MTPNVVLTGVAYDGGIMVGLVGKGKNKSEKHYRLTIFIEPVTLVLFDYREPIRICI